MGVPTLDSGAFVREPVSWLGAPVENSLPLLLLLSPISVGGVVLIVGITGSGAAPLPAAFGSRDRPAPTPAWFDFTEATVSLLSLLRTLRGGSDGAAAEWARFDSVPAAAIRDEEAPDDKLGGTAKATRGGAAADASGALLGAAGGSGTGNECRVANLSDRAGMLKSWSRLLPPEPCRRTCPLSRPGRCGLYAPPAALEATKGLTARGGAGGGGEGGFAGESGLSW